MEFVHSGQDAPTDGFDAGQELGHGEGLGEVVVGPRLETRHAIRDFAPSREHQDAGPVGPWPQATQNFEPIESGQIEIQHDEVECMVLGGRHRFRPGVCSNHLMVGTLKRTTHPSGEFSLIFNKENAHTHG